MSDAELTLKSTPPRLPRAAVVRERLLRWRDDVHERTATCVVAPAGFGKTTLLLQWRKRWLEQGAVVAWLDADPEDEPTRFAFALLHALRGASGRAGFDALAARFADASPKPMDALTGLLAGIAGLGVETVVMLDEAEQLPAATVAMLRYLLLNAPANLRVVIGSRVRLPLPETELAVEGNFALLGVEDLRLRLEETLDLLDRRFGARLGLDDRVRVHEATEGWPLGLQLALSAIEREPDAAAAVARLSARRGHLQDYFVEALATHLPRTDDGFLTRIAILEPMTADLCRAVTGDADAAASLDRMLQDTPILMVDEETQWYRLHPLARDFLLARFEQLPPTERHELHMRACRWHAAHDRYHDAARHALAAGDETRAHTLAAHSLWMLGTQGKMVEANAWLEHIPAAMLAADVPMRLMAAWIHALGPRSDEALATSLAISRDEDTTLEHRRLALRVAGAAAMYTDRAGLVAGMIEDWPHVEGTGDDPVFRVAPLNARSYCAYHAGATGEARLFAAQAIAHGETGTLRLAAAFARVIEAMSHLRDGDPVLAERVTRPALERAEREEGRRGLVPSMLAAVLAAALLDRDQPAAALTVLADRLDTIEAGPPDTALLAYRVLARAAQAQGDERRALFVLEGLESLGHRRQVPRFTAHGLAERIRIHALQGRNVLVERLLPQLDAAVAALAGDDYAPVRPRVLLSAALARAHAAIAAGRFDDADAHLDEADVVAKIANGPRDALTVQVLRAVLAQRRGVDDAPALLHEALGLAKLGGHARLLADTHPLAVRMARELPGATEPPEPARPALAPALPAPPAPRQGLLTAKEAEILQLLDKGLSNKSIARTLDISSETVKWHVKNLFAKLSAGTRRHAVDRARLLGLVG
jgi:LuxR family maltose regulon positive regulatory protein